MKICILTTDYPPMVGGICAHTVRLAQALSESSEVEHVQILALKSRHAGGEEISPKLSLIRDNHRSIFGIFFETMRYVLKFRHYDVFHASSVFPTGFFTLLIVKFLLRKPVFVTFYGTDVLTSDGKWYTKWAKEFTLRQVSNAIAFSYSTRDRTAHKYAMKPASFPVIYTPLEMRTMASDPATRAAIRTQYGIAADDFLVLFVGNLVKRKGAELLVQTLGKIEDTSLKLIIVGEGIERKNIEARIAAFGLQDRVFFAGRTTATPFFQAADVFSMPSFFDRTSDDIEGLGIVYLEAQAAGVPVIGTRSGGIPEAIDDDRSGLLVAENNVEELASAILKLRNDPVLRSQMGARGRAFVAEKFDQQESVRQHMALYRSILDA